MSKPIQPTESLELVRNEGIVKCNNSGYLECADFSKARAVYSQDDTESGSAISKDHCYSGGIGRGSEEIVSSVTNSALESRNRDGLTCHSWLGVAAKSPTKLLQAQPSCKYFENEYFKVQRSKTAGLGAIATRNLKKGDVILREKPLFTANASSVFEAYENLTGHEKDVVMSLHANTLLKPGTPRIQAVWKTNW
ncbi:hypothetical protein E4U43_002280 [Claviceps pusilla]|uniref:SET domain-containing protein n=1 Tax=Claviceps pusilla TaxID=123648 RepID=A0A9P7NIB8_9HYPO|nr:hypothetical protein E4U43_002280 [Claviceps pusilla]